MCRSILTLLAMVITVILIERLSIEIQGNVEVEPVEIVEKKPVGETEMGFAIYRLQNGKCQDEFGDQVLCPN